MTPIPCKVCDSDSPHFFTTDFHTNAQLSFGMYAIKAKPSGRLVDYYRCNGCGFLFTPYMDNWTAQEFKERVYNKDYNRLDNGYNGARGGWMANTLYLGLKDISKLRILDYGSGMGVCSHLLSGHWAGYADAHSYDPHTSLHVPDGQFDVITAQEVLEHSIDPRGSIEDLMRFRKPDGIIFATTMLVPDDIEVQRDAWWYISPRVSHISFYTKETLVKLYHGLNVVFLDAGSHIAYDKWPEFAGHLLPPGMVPR